MFCCEEENKFSFYTDHEIYNYSNLYSNNNILNEIDTVFSLPTSQHCGFAASYSNIFENNYISSDIKYNKSLLTHINDLLSFTLIDSNPIQSQETIETPEINLFWELYNQYPNILKKIKKKKIRKSKKIKNYC